MKIDFPRPKNWQDFEDLCCDLWREIWSDESTQKHGRVGQKQHGVDIFGRSNGGKAWEGVQCKLKSPGAALEDDEIEAEVENAKGFEPSLSKLTIATTAPRDTAAQKKARGLTDDTTVPFSVEIASWDEIVEELQKRPKVCARYYPSLSSGPQEDQLHTRMVEEDLARYLRRRAWNPSRARDQVRALVDKVLSGDYKRAGIDQKVEVLKWAARLSASDPETLESAKELRATLRRIDPKANTRIIDALILEAEGEQDRALRKIRDISAADAREVLFAILHRNQGVETALAWFGGQDHKTQPAWTTAFGWRNIAVALSQVNRWEEAADLLEAVGGHYPDCPELAFVEGTIHSALLLPKEVRRHALELNLYHRDMRTNEGHAADHRRQYAVQCFERAIENMKSAYPSRKKGAEEWLLWLRLTSADPEVRARAQEEIQHDILNSNEVPFRVQSALAVDIPFDKERVWRLWEDRKRLGGLDENEQKAKFLLAENHLGPREFLHFLEKEEEGLQVIPKAILTGSRIRAFLKLGQPNGAQELLDQEPGLFDEEDQVRIQAAIEQHEGKDSCGQLAALYAKTDHLLDLQNLVNCLEKEENWAALRPRLKELFGRERILKNAHRLVLCMSRQSTISFSEILGFLNKNDDLLEREPELQFAKARALFMVGQMNEAKCWNEKLLQERKDSRDLELAINITLQRGAWEEFPNIIHREWPRRHDHEPQVLMQLASLAAETDVTANRAFDLVCLAVKKARNEPRILTHAICMAYQLGREGEELRQWTVKALEQSLSSDSSEGDGSLRRVDLRTLVEEWMPAHREQAERVENLWLQGQLPVSIVASHLNIALIRLLYGIPSSNVNHEDARRRAVLPIFSGTLRPIEISSKWKLGLDITSVILLHYLGVLREVIKEFDQVVLAPDTMVVLLNERSQVRFHQPSQVQVAEEICDLIEQGRLQATPVLPAPEPFRDEVGLELGQLLQRASEVDGIVVHPRSIHKPGSFGAEAPELSDLQERLMTTIDFERLLFETGRLDAREHEEARLFLRTQDQESEYEIDQRLLSRPLFLADLAVSYLLSAGILKKLCGGNLDLWVHPSLEKEKRNLIKAQREGARLDHVISEIRVTLHQAIEEGVAVFVSRSALEDADEARAQRHAPTLFQFLQNSRPCDALCGDDRFFGGKEYIVDQKGRNISLVTVLDLLSHLEASGGLNTESRYSALNRLRRAGFALVPIEYDELVSCLQAASWQENSGFIESAELRDIRQSLARVKSMKLLQIPKELGYLEQLLRVSILAIRQIWKDKSIPVLKARALSTWVALHIPPPLDWLSKVDDDDRGNLRAAWLHYLDLMLVPLENVSGERQSEYLEWLDQHAVQPLAPANTDIFKQLIVSQKSKLKRLAQEVGQEGKVDLVLEALLQLLPPGIESEIRDDSRFLEEVVGSTQSILDFGGIVRVVREDLFEGARLIFRGSEVAHLRSLGPKKVSLIADKTKGLTLQIEGKGDESTQIIRVNFLYFLSPKREERLKTLQSLLSGFGPVDRDMSDWRMVVERRSLTDDELDDLHSILHEGVGMWQQILVEKLRASEATYEDLVPQSWNYFERFSGPDPEGYEPEEYLTSTLIAYRQELLQRDLVGGLEICLWGCLRDDLSPGAWLEAVSDDELWNALERLEPQRDPFSLLGALDLALYRCQDERFQTFTDEAISKLVEHHFPHPDGADLFNLLPVLAEFILSRIQLLPDGPLRPPFWKRLCAWMQANFVLHTLHDVSIDLEDLIPRLQGSLAPVGIYAKLLDLRKEPKIRASEISKQILRAEIVGRLKLIQKRHQAVDGSSSQAIEQGIKALEESGGACPGFWPGPLEGHVTSTFLHTVIPGVHDQVSSILEGGWRESVGGLAQVFGLSSDSIKLLEDALRAERLYAEGTQVDRRLMKLLDAASAAAVMRHESLAREVGLSTIAVAHELNNGDVLMSFEILIRASAAFENDSKSTAWLEEELAEMAKRVPCDGAKTLWNLLRKLRLVLPLEQQDILMRAQALASSAWV